MGCSPKRAAGPEKLFPAEYNGGQNRRRLPARALLRHLLPPFQQLHYYVCLRPNPTWRWGLHKPGMRHLFNQEPARTRLFQPGQRGARTVPRPESHPPHPDRHQTHERGGSQGILRRHPQEPKRENDPIPIIHSHAQRSTAGFLSTRSRNQSRNQRPG